MTLIQHGVTSIDGDLALEMPQKTSHPPMDIPYHFRTSGTMTFFPQIPRFSPGQNPENEIAYSQIANHLEKAQAFLGWKLLTLAMRDESEVISKTKTMQFFFSLWMSDRFTLEQCYNACSKNGVPSKGYTDAVPCAGQIEFPLGAWAGAGNKPTGVDFEKQFYGYPRIKRSRALP